MSRVGLLEDNTTIARLAAIMLSYVGHEVTIYEHPSDCLDALHLAEVYRGAPASLPSRTRIALPVELLILDLHLPEIDGFHMLELLRSQPHTQSLPLIFCTAATDNELKLAFQLAPRAWLVEKPFRMDQLVSAVTSALDEA
jgi:CheY-like chemotaxis protein